MPSLWSHPAAIALWLTVLGAPAIAQGRESSPAAAPGAEDAAAPEQLPAERILEVLPRLVDPDEGARIEAVEALARPDLGSTARPERVAALERVALRDESNVVRRAAITALGAIGDRGAASALARLVGSGPADQRLAAAESLGRAAEGIAALSELVRVSIAGQSGAATSGAASEAPGRPAPAFARPDALAILMPRYGQWLADVEAPTRDDYLPLIIGLKHPSPELRRASAVAFDQLIARLSDSAEPGRASRLLGELERLGIDRDVALYQRARIALSARGDAREALAVAERLVASRGVRLRPEARIDAYESQLWVFRGHYLTGLALCALGRFEDGSLALDRSAAALDRALTERRDLLTESERLRHVDLLHQRALAEVARTFAALARGADTQAVLERARSAHEVHLEAQAVFAELRGDVLTGWDALLTADLSPYRLLFGRRGFAASGPNGIGRSVIVRLQGELGRALAAVAPGELPGFDPLVPTGTAEAVARLVDPLRDPARRALIDRIRDARIGGIDEAIDEAESALARAQLRSFGVLPEDEIDALTRLQRRRFAAARAVSDGNQPDAKWLRDLRLPGSAALWYAQDLTEEGRGTEARLIATRLEADMRARGISDWWFVLGHERIVRAQLLAGSAFTDEGKGKEAESVLLRAVQGIEDIERDLQERGATERDLRGFRDLRAGALVSLAVNANVRLQDSKKALDYYERAYELRQDEFMRALMACYRARTGAEAEARALLRTIRPAPGTWYNLACTHALLGDTTRALDYLESELTQNHASVESANRQRQWAASDPDLASLRREARFQRLTRIQ